MKDNASSFSGSIPANYDQYLGPMIFEPYARDLAARVASQKPTKVLETAAGTGISTRFLRDALPVNVPIIATDLNEPMLQVARAKFDSNENIQFKPADAMNLPFDAGSFDCVASQFGVMFFPDKPASFKEVARVLAPGGRYIFNVWDSIEQNPVMKQANQFITQLYPENPPTFYKTPFGYYQLDSIRESLSAAGFEHLEFYVLKKPLSSPSAKHVASGLIDGNPVSIQIRERGQHDPGEIKNRLEKVVGSQFGEKPVRSTMQAIVVQAVKA